MGVVGVRSIYSASLAVIVEVNTTPFLALFNSEFGNDSAECYCFLIEDSP